MGMTRGLWSALRKLGMGGRTSPPVEATAPANGDAPTAPSPATPLTGPERPAVTARKTVTPSGRPHLVVRKTRAPLTAAAVEAPATRESEKVHAIRMRTKSPRVTGGKRDLVLRRRALAAAGLQAVARREEALAAMRASVRELSGSLRDIHEALVGEQARTAAVAEKLHHVPEILSALPAIAERQQVCLDRMADRTEALAVIPQALAAAQEHARAQIATLVSIREHLERRAEREEQMVTRLAAMGEALHGVATRTDAQIAEVRSLHDGQRTLVDGVRDLAASTTSEMRAQHDATWQRVETRDRQRRNRLVAVAAGLGLGAAALGAVAAHAGAGALRSMQRSSQVLAETATRDLTRVRADVAALGDLERRIAEREDELRLLLAAARTELQRDRQAHATALAAREAELTRLRAELAARRAVPAPVAEPAPAAARTAPSVPTVGE